MSTTYSSDLAYIHDAGFGGIARAAAAAVVRLVNGRFVVDLGCGSGTSARELTEAGYAVWGVDVSATMVRLARKNVPRAKFVVGSIAEVDLPECDGVIAAGEVVNYAFDRRLEIAWLARRVFRALRPGGFFLFDFLAEGGVGKSWAAGADWAVMSESVAKGDRLTRRIVSFRAVGRRYRRTDEVHEVRLLRAAEVEKALRGAGFTVRRGAYPVREGAVAIAARRPVR